MNNMENNIFDNNAKFFVGEHAISNLPYEIKVAGCRKPMIVCDETVYRLGNCKIVQRVFNNTDIEIGAVYSKIDSIAEDSICEAIARLYKNNNCDSIIAIGRKGVVAAAKGAKILLTEDVSYMSHYRASGISKYAVRSIPLYVIPTNLGSGFELSNFIRIYDKVTNSIYEFDTSYASTAAVFLDPLMTDILPPKAIASYGLFALAMAIETYAINENTPIMSKAYADIATQLLKENLKNCILRNAKSEYSLQVMHAVVCAGAAYAMIPRTLLSEMTDVISDRYHINYANTFAILFRYYIKQQEKGELFGYALNSMLAEDDFVLYAPEMRGQKTLAEIENMYKQIEDVVEYNSKLSDLKIPEEDLESIADNVLQIHKNEKENITKEQVLDLLKTAY